MSHLPPAARLSSAALGLSLLLTACGQEATPPAPAEGDVPTTPSPAPASVAFPEAPKPPVDAPGGALPLTPGVYVLAGESCAQPANAGFRIYDGRGISGSATRACRLTVAATEGETRQVDQSCIDTYSGERTTTRQTIRLTSAQGFTQTEDGDAGTFRLCPAGEAPSHLQDMVTPD